MTALDPGAAPLVEPGAFVTRSDAGTARLNLMVENLHCAGCIRKIEGALGAVPGVVSARVNMSTRRLVVDWRDGAVEPRALMRTVRDLGYPVAPFNPLELHDAAAREGRRLLTALAVAGFAAGNVMLLSVSVWAGLDGGMGVGTRGLFHWISALVALPAIAYAGQPFFRSAWSALRSRNLNMDVPISLGVLLAAALSLHQTIQGGPHTYFDAALMLLFFLLIGRYLDHHARAKARSVAEHLITLAAIAARVVAEDGSERLIPAAELEPGMIVALSAGDRVPADGVIVAGRSELDTSLVTGETLPAPTAPGEQVFTGTLNLTAPLRLRVTAVAEGTLLAEIVRLVEAAEQGRARYVRLADRAARLYAPLVHALAAATFLGWLLLAGAGWEASLTVAIAVLIITCPCALGLAVPVVQVVAAGVLLRRGVLVKSPDGLERLAEVDTVVFDKTGTLTLGRPELIANDCAEADLRLAAALARHSNHPLSRALARAGGTGGLPEVSEVAELPGRGLEGRRDGRRIRLGSRRWCGPGDTQADGTAEMELWLAVEGAEPCRFAFTDVLRPDARATLDALRTQGLAIELLSGDREAVVRAVAAELGIADWRAGCMPAEKAARLEALAVQGRKVLMVGDGLNDAPSLAAGFASISPASAADISQTAADLIFQGARLSPVPTAIDIARRARRLVTQNFALAALYNTIAVPIAVAGLVTPLIAAVAMSSSSILVTLNALRLRVAR
ncbi:MAG: heavy metal translocating P-type ATPase [Alphaproteobacteria bacterium]